VAGAAVGAVVAVGDGEAGGGVGVAVTSAIAAAFTVFAAGDVVACATVPCPAANWLTTNAMPRTLMPRPTPTAAFPMV